MMLLALWYLSRENHLLNNSKRMSFPILYDRAAQCSEVCTFRRRDRGTTRDRKAGSRAMSSSLSLFRSHHKQPWKVVTRQQRNHYATTLILRPNDDIRHWISALNTLITSKRILALHHSTTSQDGRCCLSSKEVLRYSCSTARWHGVQTRASLIWLCYRLTSNNTAVDAWLVPRVVPCQRIGQHVWRPR